MDFSSVKGKGAIVTGASRGMVKQSLNLIVRMAFFAKDCPAGRMGNPEECAYLALFLASDMARYITGAAIPVDGALAAGHQNVSTWKRPEIME